MQPGDRGLSTRRLAARRRHPLLRRRHRAHGYGSPQSRLFLSRIRTCRTKGRLQGRVETLQASNSQRRVRGRELPEPRPHLPASRSTEDGHPGAQPRAEGLAATPPAPRASRTTRLAPASGPTLPGSFERRQSSAREGTTPASTPAISLSALPTGRWPAWREPLPRAIAHRA